MKNFQYAQAAQVAQYIAQYYYGYDKENVFYHYLG
jgi:hypothetical protein